MNHNFNDNVQYDNDDPVKNENNEHSEETRSGDENENNEESKETRSNDYDSEEEEEEFTEEETSPSLCQFNRLRTPSQRY